MLLSRARRKMFHRVDFSLSSQLERHASDKRHETSPCAAVTASRSVIQLVAALMLVALPVSASASPELSTATTQATGHGGMTMGSSSRPQGQRQPPRCRPLSDEERVDAFDLFGYTHTIATDSRAAQRLFDQGMLLAYDYNQPEALAAFRTGLRIDPQAAMLHWGVAYASAPYMNKVAGPPPEGGSYPVFTAEELQQGREALQAAVQLVEQQLTQVQLQPSVQLQPGGADRVAQLQHDKLYIDALSDVFNVPRPYGPEFEAAELQYATRLQAIAAVYPLDADAPALAAEALGNLQPWDFWDPVSKAPQRWTMKALELVNQSLARNPRQALAAHLMVHMTEASNPGRGPNSAVRAEGAADMLSSQYPAFGHLTHMGAHTYIRIGRWHDAVTANVAALKADKRDADRCLEPYVPFHNAAMLIYAASLGAEQGTAEAWAAKLAQFAADYGPTYMTDGRDRAALPLVWTHFAHWEPLLKVALEDLDPTNDGVMLPPAALKANKVLYHYMRTLALAATAQHAAVHSVPEAEAARGRVTEELVALRAAVADLPPDPITKPGQGLGIYSPGYRAFASEAVQVASARVAVLDGHWALAKDHLAKAVVLEFLPGYTEPPRFYQPVRQCLGWVLLQSGDAAAAAAMYEQDLRDYPNNPWSLVGLRDALKAQLADPPPPSASPQRSIKLGAASLTPTLAAMGSRQATAEALQQVEARLQEALVHADPAAPLTSSCPSFAVLHGAKP